MNLKFSSIKASKGSCNGKKHHFWLIFDRVRSNPLQLFSRVHIADILRPGPPKKTLVLRYPEPMVLGISGPGK